MLDPPSRIGGAAVTIRLIRADEARRRLGIGRTKFEQMISRGEFPAPLRMGAVRVWPEHEVEEWLVNYIAAQSRGMG